MKYRNLDRHGKAAYNRAILRSHRRRREVRIYTLDDVFVQSLTPVFLGGECTGDDSSSPSRVATFDVLEPTRGLVFEPDDAASESLHRHYKIEVVDARQIMELDGEWVEQTIIYGPCWDYSREGAVVHLEVDGTDRLAMGSVRKAHAWLRKTKVTDVLRHLLVLAGSTRNRIPDLKQRTPVHVHVGVTHHTDEHGHKHTRKHRRVRGFTVHRTDTYLGKATKLAASLNRHLYADAEGVFKVRRTPKKPVFRFTDATLLTEPQLEKPTRDGPNTFIVLGGKPKGGKRRVSSGKVGFGPHNPDSAANLAWNDQPYEVIDQRSNPHVHNKGRAREIAKDVRDNHERMTVGTVVIECLPIPWLVAEERFRVSAATKYGLPTSVVHSWTYPLGSDGSPMTLGAARRAVPLTKHRRPVRGSHGVA